MTRYLVILNQKVIGVVEKPNNIFERSDFIGYYDAVQIDNDELFQIGDTYDHGYLIQNRSFQSVISDFEIDDVLKEEE